MMTPEADIILACQKIHDESNIQTKLVWLKTRQDIGKCRETLAEAQLNGWMINPSTLESQTKSTMNCHTQEAADNAEC